MKIRTYGATHTGMTRITNEDNFFLSDFHHTYAVADGIGGLPGGAQTSERIVSLLERAYPPFPEEAAYHDLTELVLQINRIITHEVSIEHPETGAGSTLTLAQAFGGQLHIAHVGDSAAFILHQGHLEQLTTDHTMEEEIIRTRGDAARSTMPPEYAHTLTRCIGQPEDLQVDYFRAHLVSGDRVLLCTDGFHKVTGETTIQNLLQTGDSPEDICQSMIDAANAQGSPDNITVIVAIVDSIDAEHTGKQNP